MNDGASAEGGEWWDFSGWVASLSHSVLWFGRGFLAPRSQFIKGTLTDALIVAFLGCSSVRGELPTGKVREKQSLA